MPQARKKSEVTEQYIKPVKGRTGYGAVEKALEVRGGPKRAKIGDREKVFRKYHLTQEKVQAKLAQWHATGKFVSPYCKSVTTDFLNALADLGLNKAHHTGRVVATMRRMMNVPDRIRDDGMTDWEVFEKKEKRTDNGKSLPGRLETLARNLRKTKGSGSPYPEGRKLEQIGCCVDIFIREWKEEEPHRDPELRAKGETEWMPKKECFFRLNTHSTEPRIIRVVNVEDVSLHPVDRSAKTMGPE